MKKVIVILIVFSFILPLYSGSKAAMSKFMGHQWETTADVFWKTFQFKEGCMFHGSAIIVENYELAEDLWVRLTIYFSSESEIEFTKENYSKFRLTDVRWRFLSDHYDTMVNIFKFKYGAPVEEKSYTSSTRRGFKETTKWCKWEASGRYVIIEHSLDNKIFASAYMGPVDRKVREKKVNIEDAATKF